MDKTPLTGNAVLSGTAVIAVVIAVIGLLRAYGHDVTPGQEDAWLAFLNSPVGELIALAVTLAAGYVMRSNVYSRLSVLNITGRVDPPVLPEPPVPTGSRTV